MVTFIGFTIIKLLDAKFSHRNWRRFRCIRKSCNCVHAYQQCSISRDYHTLNSVLRWTSEQNDFCTDIAVRRHKAWIWLQMSHVQQNLHQWLVPKLSSPTCMIGKTTLSYHNTSIFTIVIDLILPLPLWHRPIIITYQCLFHMTYFFPDRSDLGLYNYLTQHTLWINFYELSLFTSLLWTFVNLSINFNFYFDDRAYFSTNFNVWYLIWSLGGTDLLRIINHQSHPVLYRLIHPLLCRNLATIIWRGSPIILLPSDLA